MPRRLRSSEEIEVSEANVLPVMNIMFLLIPALLLAMEVASMAAVSISPPKFTDAPSSTPEPAAQEKKLELKVFILAEGFRVSSAAQQQGADAGKAVDSGAPTIPLAKLGAPAEDYDRYDYAALEVLAGEFKYAYPAETVVTVSAENDVPAQVLINTLDALRGLDCKLASLGPDDDIPGECLFFRPVVEAGAG